MIFPLLFPSSGLNTSERSKFDKTMTFGRFVHVRAHRLGISRWIESLKLVAICFCLLLICRYGFMQLSLYVYSDLSFQDLSEYWSMLSLGTIETYRGSAGRLALHVCHAVSNHDDSLEAKCLLEMLDHSRLAPGLRRRASVVEASVPTWTNSKTWQALPTWTITELNKLYRLR